LTSEMKWLISFLAAVRKKELQIRTQERERLIVIVFPPVSLCSMRASVALGVCRLAFVTRGGVSPQVGPGNSRAVENEVDGVISKAI